MHKGLSCLRIQHSIQLLGISTFWHTNHRHSASNGDHNLLLIVSHYSAAELGQRGLGSVERQITVGCVAVQAPLDDLTSLSHNSTFSRAENCAVFRLYIFVGQPSGDGLNRLAERISEHLQRIFSSCLQTGTFQHLLRHSLGCILSQFRSPPVGRDKNSRT